MTDREALNKAQNELDTSSYLAEVTLNKKGLQKIHQNRIAWLSRVLRLARKALYIEENQKQIKTKGDCIRAMNDEELARHLHDIGWDCHLCAEHRRLDNEPLLRYEKCDEKCVKHCLEWLEQPAE